MSQTCNPRDDHSKKRKTGAQRHYHTNTWWTVIKANQKKCIQCLNQNEEITKHKTVQRENTTQTRCMHDAMNQLNELRQEDERTMHIQRSERSGKRRWEQGGHGGGLQKWRKGHSFPSTKQLNTQEIHSQPLLRSPQIFHTPTPSAWLVQSISFFTSKVSNYPQLLNEGRLRSNVRTHNYYIFFFTLIVEVNNDD